MAHLLLLYVRHDSGFSEGSMYSSLPWASNPTQTEAQSFILSLSS